MKLKFPAWAVTIWGGIYFVVDLLGNIDFMLQTYQDLNWLQKVIRFLIDPPWLFQFAIFVGGCGWLGWLWFSHRGQSQVLPNKSSSNQEIVPEQTTRDDRNDPLYWEIELAGEGSLSWWHVKIRLRPNSSVKLLEGCRAYVKSDFLQPQRRMRWRSDNAYGAGEVTLRLGNEPEIVPIAIRSESAVLINAAQLPPYVASLTDEGFLVHKNISALAAGQRHPLTVEIQSSDKRWKKDFLLDVPPQNASNGHFILHFNPMDDFLAMGVFTKPD